MTTRKKPDNVLLSAASIQRLRGNGKLYRVWDSEVRGFHVQVTPAGTKSYRVQFQRKNGKKVFITICKVEELTLEEARKKAAKYREDHTEGVDIMSRRKDLLKAESLTALYGLWKTKAMPKLKPSTQASYQSIWNTTIKPVLGDRLVKDLNRKQVSELHTNATKKKNAGTKRPQKTNANRAIAVLSSLLRFAMNEGWREEGTINPCQGFAKNQETPRDRCLSVAEYEKLGTSLTALVQTKKLDPVVANIIRFLALSGLRKSEVLGLKFTDLDEDAGIMRFRDHKTAGTMGTKKLPLNSHLKAIIKEQAAQRISPYVFPGWTDSGPVVGLARMWARVMGDAGIADVTPHDLRRTFYTTVVKLTLSYDVADVLTGHKPPKIRVTYGINPEESPIVVQASQDAADWIAAAMAGEKVQPGVKVSKEKTAQDGTA